MRRPFKRARFINWGCVGPALLALVAAIAMIVGAVSFLHRAHHAAPTPTSALQRTSDGTLTRELARCQALGRKAEDDSHCLSAWAENRRRFFQFAPSSKKTTQP